MRARTLPRRHFFGKYQAQVRHLFQAYILLIMGLFEVLLTNMMLICGANNNSSIKYSPIILGEKVLKPGFLGG